MPQITNTTNKDIWFGQLGITVPANGYVNSDVYPVVATNPAVTTSATVVPAGLSINNALYAMDPILFFATYSISTNVTLPQTIVPRTSYKVKILCTVGTVAVKFNYSGNTSFTIPAGDVFEITCQSRTIDNILFTIGSGTVYLTVRTA